MARIRCPTCNSLFDPESCKTMPFCSERCRQIDLGRWLDEQISIPLAPEDLADEPVHDDFENE